MIELIDSPQVRRYELTYLIPVSLTSGEASQTHQAVTDLVKKYEGTVIAQEDWGKKDLAYAIRHASSDQREAVYTHLLVELPASNVQGLERDLRLQSHLMRYLLVLAETGATATTVSTKEEAAA